MKRLPCKNCGVARKMMIKANVREYGHGMIEVGLAWLCFVCLLRGVHLGTVGPKSVVIFDHKKAMELAE